MIKKFLKIRSIGKLVECSPVGDVTLRKLSLIYGRNGHGKTTLGDILRSLSTGDPNYILGRATLGNALPPSAQIQLGDGTIVSFKDGKWDAPGPAIRIFDAAFVDANIHSGNTIETGHKRSLYTVMVGEEGIKLADAVNQLADQMTAANTEIREKQKRVDDTKPPGMALKTFLSLERLEKIEGLVATKQAEVQTLKSADEIVRRPELTPIALPDLPEDFETLMAAGIEDLSTAAEQAVKTHLTAHQKPGGERWLAAGLEYSNGVDCPFCGRALGGLALIDSYRAYFGASYAALKQRLAALQGNCNEGLGEAPLLAMQKALEANASGLEYWKRHADVTLPALEFENLRTAVANLREQTSRRCKAKLASPLESIAVDDDFLTALNTRQTLLGHVTAYNQAIESANRVIAAKKDAARKGGLPAAEKQLAELLATRLRFEPRTENACREYMEAEKWKDALDKRKAAANDKLKEYGNTVFAKLETRINQLLAQFAAGFRIGATKPSVQGGAPSSSFQIVINDVLVDPGKPDTPLTKPSFRNTLSAGDRSTLALAFFIASIQNDPDLGQSIVLFDDPFTSMDASRRMRTVQGIVRFAGSCRQVIVLSHDAHFLKRIEREKGAVETKALAITHETEGRATIAELDLFELTKSDYFNHFDALLAFQERRNKETAKAAAQALRIVVEGYLRTKFPREFGPPRSTTLGTMIDEIRIAQGSMPLARMNPHHQSLSAINEYSRPFHHGAGAAAAAEAIEIDELRTFVDQALEIVRS